MADSATSLTDEDLQNCSGGEFVTVKESKHQVGDHVAIKIESMGIYCGVEQAQVLEVQFEDYRPNDEGQMTYRVWYRVLDEDNRTYRVQLEDLLA